MDAQTQHTLNRISRNLPRHLAGRTTKVEIDTTEEELARAALASGQIDPAKKKIIRRMLHQGRFRRSETVVDEETVAQIDKFHTQEIAKARRSGKLADPMKDPFYRSRMERLARGDIRKADPLSRQEIENARRILSQKPIK